MGALRAKKLVTSPSSTQWQTVSGGLFIEPLHRPDADVKDVTFTVTLSRADYKVLEVLFDNVPDYVTRMMVSHVRGLRKSAKHNNAKQRGKQNGNGK